MITNESLLRHETPIALVGLGYVGLPLAVAFARHYRVLGFDISARRVEQLRKGQDLTREVSDAKLAEALASGRLEFSCDPTDLRQARLIIVAVPTPIDEHRNPDLKPLTSSSTTVGQHLSPGSVVVYESTVYPGLTEEHCGPLLEKHSGLVRGEDFFLGYSPERINPGDQKHTLETIVKVVAGENPVVTELLAQVYGSVVSAGVHRAPSIQVAEAAKVIENTQRDLNIALMNELAVIFHRQGLDTREVLEAAGTKWNFLPFTPGLVGGHCIGVDPYYLTYRAQYLGLHPAIILAGRRINDSMGGYVAQQCVKLLSGLGGPVHKARVAVLGLTFKENVPDLRNTRVVDILHELEAYGVETLIHDPMADPAEALEEYGATLSSLDELRDLDAVILAVPHRAYAGIAPEELRGWFAEPSRALVLDVKWLFDKAAMEAAGIHFWRL